MNLAYRPEVLAPLFERISALESCAIVGCASMGKSRLLRFMLEPETRAHYTCVSTPSAPYSPIAIATG